MAAHTLENEFLHYWSQLSVVQQQSIVSVIKSIVEPQERVSIEQYNREIDEAMNRIDQGEFTTQEDVEKEAEQW